MRRQQFNTNNRMRHKMKLERNLTINVFCLVASFMITWMPFALVSFASIFIGPRLGPVVSTVSAMFAKSSLLWSTLFYMFSNKNIKRILFQMFKLTEKKKKKNKKKMNEIQNKELNKNEFKNGRFPVLL